MYNFWQRGNALLTLSSTTLAALCILTTITDYFHVNNPTIDLKYLGVRALVNEHGFDRVLPQLSLQADLRNEFTWNTKQIYLSITVDYSTPTEPSNTITMWNTIILKKEQALINIAPIGVIYPFSVSHDGESLINRPVNFTVYWNVMPKVGALQTRQRSFGPYTLPSEYKGKVPRPRVVSIIYGEEHMGDIDDGDVGFYID